MEALTTILLPFCCAIVAGLLGALTGLGGGVVITSCLVLLFGIDLRTAIGVSLIAVIATSVGAAAAYVREGFTNVRLAIVLEVATVAGALAGAFLAPHVPTRALGILFGCVILWSAWNARRAPVASSHAGEPADALAVKLRLDSTYLTRSADGETVLSPYHVRRVPLGFGIMLGAGVLSALLGIGSGVFKVLAMDRVMRVPFKVSTTTSNFMIGVTAAASAAVYLKRGEINVPLAAPVALGALAGAVLGARLLPKVSTRVLRMVFACVIGVAGVQMLYRAAKGSL